MAGAKPGFSVLDGWIGFGEGCDFPLAVWVFGLIAP